MPLPLHQDSTRRQQQQPALQGQGQGQQQQQQAQAPALQGQQQQQRQPAPAGDEVSETSHAEQESARPAKKARVQWAGELQVCWPSLPARICCAPPRPALYPPSLLTNTNTNTNTCRAASSARSASWALAWLCPRRSCA